MDAATQLQSELAIEDSEERHMAQATFLSDSGPYGILHDPNPRSHSSHGPLIQLYGENNMSAFNSGFYVPTPAHGLQASCHTFMHGTHQESNSPALLPTGSRVSDIQSYGYSSPDRILPSSGLQESGSLAIQRIARSEVAPMVAEPLNLDQNEGIVGTSNWIALKKPRPRAGENVIILRRDYHVAFEIILVHLPLGDCDGIKIPATASVKNFANTTSKAPLEFRIRLYGATTRRLYEVVCENCQKRDGKRRGTPSLIDFKAEYDVIEPKDGKIRVEFSFCCYPKCHKLGDTEYLLDIVLSVDEGQHYIVAQCRFPLSFHVVSKLPPRQIPAPVRAEEEGGDPPTPEPTPQGRMGGANPLVLGSPPGDRRMHHQWPDTHYTSQGFDDGFSRPPPLLERDRERTPTLTEVNPDSASIAGGVRIWLKGMDFPALLPLFARFGPAVVPTTFSASNLLACHLPPRTVRGVINVTLSKDPQPNAPEYGMSIARFTYKEEVDELVLILLRIQDQEPSPLLQAVLNTLSDQAKLALDRGTNTQGPVELPPTYASGSEYSVCGNWTASADTESFIRATPSSLSSLRLAGEPLSFSRPPDSSSSDDTEELSMHTAPEEMEEPDIMKSSSASVREMEGLDMSAGFQHVGRPAHAVGQSESTNNHFPISDEQANLVWAMRKMTEIHPQPYIVSSARLQGAPADESFNHTTPFSISSYRQAGEPLPPSPDSPSSVDDTEVRVVLKGSSAGAGKMEGLDKSPGSRHRHDGRPAYAVARGESTNYHFPAAEENERRDTKDTGRVKRRTTAPKDNAPLRRLKTTFLRFYRRLRSRARIGSDSTTIRGKSTPIEVDYQLGQSPPIIVQSHHGPLTSGTRSDGPTSARSGGHTGVVNRSVRCSGSSSASPPGISRVTNTPPIARSNGGGIAGNSTGITRTNDGSLSLEDPIESGLVEALSGLRGRCNFRAKLSTTNDWGQTLAHLSIIYGYPSLLKSLVDWRINLAIADRNGLTALHYAYMMGDLDSVRILWRSAAPELAKDKLGRTPLDLRPEGFGTS